MVSIGVLNTVLNAFLWLLHALLTTLAHKIYTAAAKMQFIKNGATTCSNVEEINILHHIPRIRACRASTWWSISLAILMLLLVPADLFVETGISVKEDCSEKDVTVQDGVCASKWAGHSDAGVTAAALLVQRFEWIDREWDIVFEGSSKRMVAAEVRREARVGKELYDARRIFAYQCKTKVSPCSDCGEFTVAREAGPFDTVILASTLRPTPGADSTSTYARGDLTYDGALGVAFYFWEMPAIPVELSQRTTQKSSGYRIRAAGVETVLTEEQIARVLEKSVEPWSFSLTPKLARVYDIECRTSNLTSGDMAQAVSLYRTTQMEQPGVRRSHVKQNLALLEPLNQSDALKALFALKAEDGTSVCRGEIPVYTTCAWYDWRRGVAFAAIGGVVAVGWVIALWMSRKTGDVFVPYDAESWRKFATMSDRGGVGIQMGERGGVGGIILTRVSAKDFSPYDDYEDEYTDRRVVM